MQISENGLSLIKKFEGFSAKPYLCPAGKLTIGFGHVIKKGEEFPDSGINVINAEKLLKTDVGIAEKAIAKWVNIPISQHQFDALVSFVYNIGTRAFRGSTMLRLLRENKPEQAAGEFSKWIYAGGKVQNGLLKRRAEERAMFTFPLPQPILPYS